MSTTARSEGRPGDGGAGNPGTPGCNWTRTRPISRTPPARWPAPGKSWTAWKRSRRWRICSSRGWIRSRKSEPGPGGAAGSRRLARQGPRGRGAGCRRRGRSLESAQSQLARAQAKLRHDQVLFDYSKITAPFAGVVTKRYANQGTLMQSGMNSSTQALPLVQLSEDDLFRLVIPVPESYVPYIRHRRSGRRAGPFSKPELSRQSGALLGGRRGGHAHHAHRSGRAESEGVLMPGDVCGSHADARSQKAACSRCRRKPSTSKATREPSGWSIPPDKVEERDGDAGSGDAATTSKCLPD